MAFIPSNGSVVAFQNPGSILAASIAGGNINVNNFPTNQNVSGSVAAWLQSTNASVITVGTAAANQSVSGTVNVGNFPTNQNVSGSVVAWLVSTNASVITVGTAVPNQSVSGTVNVGNFPTTQNVSGSVVAFQGTPEWTVKSSLAGGIFPISGSVAATITNTNVNVSGSVAGTYIEPTVVTSVTGMAIVFKSNANTSVMTAVGVGAPLPVSVQGVIQVSGNPSISGTVQVGNFPTTQNVSGSVVAFQGTPEWTVKSSIAGGIFPVSGSVAATITNTNVNVSGSVASFQAGTQVTSLVSTVPSSVIVGTSIFGQLPAGTAPLGSVATLQGTNPWIVNFQNSSIITVFSAPSIVGTYAEDTAHAASEKGLFILGVRNDTMSSVTSADGEYTLTARGPIGEAIVANSPITKWVQGTTSVFNQFGASMATIAAQGASVFTYITGIQVVNMSASSVLVTFSGATSSIVGYTIAPPGGGSNILYPNALKTNENGAFTTSVSGVCSVYVSAQGFISKT